MADATTIKGSKVRVLLDPTATGDYVAPCGFLSKSITITKGTEDFNGVDCDDPSKLPWLFRDATSLSMGISGEGVLAEQSVETWLDAVENEDSIPTKVEWEFPTKTITWTGLMHVSTFTAAHTTPRGRATSSIEMASDGTMSRVVT